MKRIIFLLSVTLLIFSCKEETSKTDSKTIETKNATTKSNAIKVHPIAHATTVIEGEQTVIYIDPVGGAEAFKGMKPPQLVLITDIHGDHLNVDTLMALGLQNTTLVVPQAVADKLPEILKDNLVILGNGKTSTIKNPKKYIDVKIQAIPMYNLRPEDLNKHPKGRGNGYVITLDGTRIYFSGDTEDISEMRALKNIDMAFVCMNLPYTMTVEKAADAVLEFKPKQVYPYHYRGKDGLSDVTLFKMLLNSQNTDIEVIQLNWYR